MLGGVNYNYYITASPRTLRKSLRSGIIGNLILAFLVVLVSAFVLATLQNYLLSKNFFNSSSDFKSSREILNQGYIKVEYPEIESNLDQLPIEMAKVRWLHKLLGVKTVYAASLPYRAERLSTNCRAINIEPAKALTCEVSFKNTGTRTWYNSGKNYVSFYADNLGKLFRHKYWWSPNQPARLLETKVLPGEVGHLRFALLAPELLGLYPIKLKLAAEDLAWIEGGQLEIPINVTLSNTLLVHSQTVSDASPEFKAEKFLQSHNSTINLNLGEKVTYRVVFRNTGQATWQSTGEKTVKICLWPLERQSSFYDSSWLSSSCPTALSSSVLPGQLGFFSFTLQSSIAGKFEENFVLMSGNELISGGDFIVPITVNFTELKEQNLNLGSEPTIRIGLYSTTDPVSLKATGSFEVRDESNNLIASVPAEKSVQALFDFNTKKYALNFEGSLQNNLSYLRFVPHESSTIFEITNYENRPSWNSSLNDNKFRGILELRYSEARDKLYVINELPMEAYLFGLAESSNGSPYEFQKALVVAARTYAQYNLNIGGKHPAAYFTLNATAWDQLYRGYNSEIRMPDLVQAVKETKGLVITYNNEVVVTPYFSQSDGRTRSWEEVWAGGPKPWLVSKPDPYCVGLTLWGHGVGLSARGAAKMARDGSNFEQILKYYYTGIELKKIY